MFERLRQFALILFAGIASAMLGGCLITNVSGNNAGGLFSGQATATLQRESPCTVDTAAVVTTCTPVMQVAAGGITQSFPFLIRLLGYAAPLTLWDPVIVQVPASMSNFAGSIAAGPPGVAPDTPLSITAGLTSIPIDARTNLVAEPGMQLVIIDFDAPEGMPFGTYTLKFQFSGTTSSIKVLFAAKITAGAKSAAGEAIDMKAAQSYYVPIYPCVADMASVLPINLPLTNISGLLSVIVGAQGCNGKAYDFAGLGTGSDNVVEYYNASLDHYFISWVPDEIAKLDAGTVIKGWTRTGKALKTYTTKQTGTSPVCRYYIPPGLGDSHFFGRGVTECTSTGAKNPSFVLEDPAFMQMFLPTLGVCPVNTTQVYRVFSNRADANHRYMTDKATRDQMVAKGWLPEGDGPDLVVMCQPF
jgi:hypothetical protein